MFKPMAQTVTFALIGAFILSLTYVPMMSAWALSKNKNAYPTLSDRVMLKIEILFQRTLEFFVKLPKLVVGSAFVLFVISLFILTRLGGEFIPALEEGDFAVDTRVLTGSSIQTTIDGTQAAARIYQKIILK